MCDASIFRNRCTLHMNCSCECDCVVDSGRDLVRRANTMRHSRDSWRRDRTRAGGWVKAAFFAPRSGRRFVRGALRRPPASATICERVKEIGPAMMMWAPDQPSGSPADVLVELLAGRLALVPGKIRYALPQPWTGVTPGIRDGFWPVMYRQKWGRSRPQSGFLRVPILTVAVTFFTRPEQLSSAFDRTGFRTRHRTYVAENGSIFEHWCSRTCWQVSQLKIKFHGCLHLELKVEPNFFLNIRVRSLERGDGS
jgi:hypothetical protein